AAGMVEMLLQSHLGTIDLLPALPDAIPEGKIKGVCARGGFELAFEWKNGELQSIEVLSKAGEKCHLRYRDWHMDFDTEKGKAYAFNGQLERLR
ncbi:MAG: glycoside hydrolase family 95 protein, partial [Bacteroidales bacterium]|nr:glycoside hydrolase family 95 protein [Bacteroidales bacterium]